MGEAYSTHEIVEKPIKMLSDNLKGRNNFENLGVGRRILQREVVDRTHLAEDREKWRVLVNAVVNLQFHKS
jgi:hypothetical protein